ncbi:endo-1,4-beta-xylanase [Prevotella sp. P2-180]|uniref:endo-1,4-beta-xylanase n=1 Tax=Prevotella sp. P2-180 TaxID=2024224 RepID=UPI000B97A419|nr:endo-1,4-beta-xylanase [Prevotella sp. P2-180]OYP62069.1 glycosyl hydrolase family 10 [Prevotella sp. P2-180]
MKHTNKILGTMLLAAAVSTSCVDDDKLGFAFEKPASIEGMEYLADYDALKAYVDRSANPNFKLGVALAADDYNAGGVVTRLANSNFDEMTAGNAMKYASCVADNGAMDFGKVSTFVNNAKENGITIYGHTLAWHSQQNNNYLNGIIAPKEIPIDPNAKNEVEDKKTNFADYASFPFYVMGYKPDIIDGVLTSNNPTEWHQYFVLDGCPTEQGKAYKVTAMIRGSKEGQLNVQFGDWGGMETGPLAFSTEWEEQTIQFNSALAGNSFVVFQPGSFDGTLEIKWVKVSHTEAPAIEIFNDQLTNGEMVAGKPMNNFVVREAGKGDVPGNPIAGGPEGKNCIKITSIANPTNSWDTQFFIYTPDKAWAGGEKYKISFWYKASEAAGSESQCHGEPGGYKHYQMLPTNPSFTTEWQYYEATSSIPASGDGMKSIAFNLNVNKNQVDYYFADIHWYTVEKGNKIPLTPEEKKDTLTWAMDNWITGMMQACEGYVTSWDVVNEALSGDDKDGDGWYDLQSATRNTVREDDKANNFYWQDYLGDLDYVRTAVGLARKRFAENGGQGELKLFINDYNLESDWDDNKKLKSLIHWIQEWESDGVTKIDGIGSQMHVSCYADANIQKSKEEHVVKMLQLMKESGKLCKISELDMGFVDANDKSVKTEDLTEEQHKKMAAYYSFIVRKYFEIIPANQRYGITQWCITDAPDSSGWRGGEPVGLWDSNYYRKHTYAGFADGLQGKEYSK